MSLNDLKLGQLLHPETIEYGRWTQFCDPLKKKNWDEFTGGLFFKKYWIQDLHHNNSNNSETTFVKLSEKIQYFITEFIDVWLQFTESYCFVTVAVKRAKLGVTVLWLWRSKERNNRFIFNEIWKLISIKLLIFRFDKGNLISSINAAMLK